ncbi:histidine phosphatase family protein [Microbacterium sp. ASV49]|uniref:Histidine phosphatase family protein n=1 Tax=Microbacterium candidum TaxID=3041922 RepID=A0ABT7MXR7_9MICO|nr:histidine phosphatase family protein [Microbacterium sp. ASV49]MDL9979235.1 histidine phosphatase family protein [Microbacterium sp. ASV49]
MRKFLPRIAIAAVVAIGATTLTGWAVSAANAAPASVGTAAASPATSNRDATVQIYLTRHGKTILNSLDRVQGWSDSPLTAAGRDVAETVGKNLSAREGTFDAAYSADMVRHFETASIMLKAMGSKLTPTRLEGLREIDFGKFEGAENAKMYGPIMAKLGITNPADLFTHNLDELMSAMKTVASTPDLPAEDCADVDVRMMASLNEIASDAAKHREGKVLVVSSGISISCVLESMGAETPATGIANGAVNLLEYKGGAWTVKSVNDTSYAQ